MNNSDSRHAIFLGHILKCQTRIYGYIYALVPNMSVVDDILQETILVMWEKFDTFQEGTSFFAWSKKIAYFKVINYLERSHHRDVYFNEEVLASIEKQSDIFERSDIRVEALENCMARLGDNDKELLRLKYAEGMSIKEVARHKSRSADGMYKVMARIHSVLEECIRRNLASGMEGVR